MHRIGRSGGKGATTCQPASPQTRLTLARKTPAKLPDQGPPPNLHVDCALGSNPRVGSRQSLRIRGPAQCTKLYTNPSATQLSETNRHGQCKLTILRCGWAGTRMAAGWVSGRWVGGSWSCSWGGVAGVGLGGAGWGWGGLGEAWVVKGLAKETGMAGWM